MFMNVTGIFIIKSLYIECYNYFFLLLTRVYIIGVYKRDHIKPSSALHLQYQMSRTQKNQGNIR